MDQIHDYPPGTISCRAYAKRRGVSAAAVSEAIRSGRLVKSVVRGGEFGQPKILDADLADREWEANTDPQRRINAAGGVDPRALVAPVPVLISGPPPPMLGTIDVPPPRVVAPAVPDEATATQRLKAAQADLAELKFAEAAGELVPAADVERRLVDVFSACKSRLLAIPSRAKQALPHLTTADVLELDKLIREALEELAEAKA